MIMLMLMCAFQRRHEEGKAWKDMAVLFRTNTTGGVFQEALRAGTVPFALQVIAALDFDLPYLFDSKMALVKLSMCQGEHVYSSLEIDDVLSLLRLVCNPEDDRAYLRVAKLLRCPIPEDTYQVRRVTFHWQSTGHNFKAWRDDYFHICHYKATFTFFVRRFDDTATHSK